MTVRKIWILGILAAAASLAACGERHDESGSVRTETRPVEAFEAIDMRGDARLEVRVGEAESLTAEGRDAVLRRLRTEVRGDTLYISTRGRKILIFGQGEQGLTVRITVPHLAALKLRGGNDVQLDGFQGGESSISAEGAAHIKASGHLRELTVRMAGAGFADLNDLLADQAKVTVDGVGSVYVNSKDSLDATMNGVGAIFYKGSPRDVRTKMNGLGTISQQGASEREPSREWRGKDRSEDEREQHDAPTEVI